MRCGAQANRHALVHCVLCRQAMGLGRTSTWLPGCAVFPEALHDRRSTTCLSPKPPHNLSPAVALKNIPPAQMTATSPILSVPNMPHAFSCYRLPTYRPRTGYLPPVRLKEFPKAENELRGVKSGLLGLLTGLHKPELMLQGKYTKWWLVNQAHGSHGGSDMKAQRRGNLRWLPQKRHHPPWGVPTSLLAKGEPHTCQSHHCQQECVKCQGCWKNLICLKKF